MSPGLHLTTDEFDRMVECGAFDHLHRKIELIRGEIREMNPAGPLHDGLIIYMTDWSGRNAPESTGKSIAKPGEFLSPLACAEARLDVGDLFTSE